MLAFSSVSLLALATLPAFVLGHARINSPPIRVPGPAHLAACGQPSFDEITADETGHIEDQEPVNPGCELTLCRGMPFIDQQVANIQVMAPGDPMTMDIDCTIAHGGPANVTLVDTTVGGNGEIIGTELASFDDFCPLSGETPADQSNLQFTVPGSDTLGKRCQGGGQCVVQLFWATPDLSQNYYYCVDVLIYPGFQSRKREFHSRVNPRGFKLIL